MVVVPTGGAPTFIDGCCGAEVVAHKATCGRGRWREGVVAACGAVVAGIEMPWRQDDDDGGMCVGGDQLL